MPMAAIWQYINDQSEIYEDYLIKREIIHYTVFFFLLEGKKKGSISYHIFPVKGYI